MAHFEFCAPYFLVCVRKGLATSFSLAAVLGKFSSLSSDLYR